MRTSATPRKLTEGEFYGSRIRTATHSGFRYSDTRYGPGRQLPAHSHEHSLFCYLAAGSYRERVGRRWIDLQPGSVGFVPSSETHRGVIEAPSRALQVEVLPELMARTERLGGGPPGPVFWHTGRAAWLARRLFREFSQRRPASELMLEGIALELLAQALRAPDPRADRGRPRWLRDARDRVHESLGEKLAIGGLADELGVDPLRLSRGFRRHFGESIGRMHRRLRIEEACRRLAREDVRIVDVAASLGFADQSHFTRVFRELTGTTPASYRRSTRR